MENLNFYTKLNTITRLIYRPEDDPILEYLEDDGEQVEPIYYVPIIPMVLVNGSKGIGTGFSSDIMCYNVFQIIEKFVNDPRAFRVGRVIKVEPIDFDGCDSLGA